MYLGLVYLGLAYLGLVYLGLMSLGLVYPGLISLGLRIGSAGRPCMTKSTQLEGKKVAKNESKNGVK